MNAPGHEIAQCIIHKAMTIDGGQTVEALGPDSQREMRAVRSAAVARVPNVLRCVILDLDDLGRQGFAQHSLHFIRCHEFLVHDLTSLVSTTWRLRYTP